MGWFLIVFRTGSEAVGRSARRRELKAIWARAAELVAEEMALRELRDARKFPTARR
jgi:hypothetical protein